MRIRFSLVLVFSICGLLSDERTQATTALPCPSIGAQARSSATIQSDSDHFCEDWSGVLIPPIAGRNEIIRVNLGRANLQGAVIEPQMAFFNLESADLRDAVVSGIPESNLRSADLSRVSLTGSGHDFDGTDMTYAVVRDAHLGGIFFGPNTRLSLTDLSGSDLTQATLFATTLNSTNFTGANISYVYWSQVDLRTAIFTEAVGLGTGRFEFSILSGMDLSGIDFVGCSLSDSDLRGVNLSHSTFRGCSSFNGTDFRGALLLGTDISNAPYGDLLNDAIFDATTLYDAETVFPVGFDPVAYGLTFVPEPGTAVLVMTGLLGLAARRRRPGGTAMLANS